MKASEFSFEPCILMLGRVIPFARVLGFNERGRVMKRFVLFFVLLSVANFSFAADQIPDCLAYGRPLPVNNSQVLHWRRTTPNQFRERGHIQGTITQIFADKSGHDHFEIQIGKQVDDVVEVIYNQDFGALPEVRAGMTVEACGDYITATAQSGPYPPSPSGAIIHWVHMNPSGRGHDPGFLAIDGTLYGQDAENAGPRDRPAYDGKGHGSNDWKNK